MSIECLSLDGSYTLFNPDYQENYHNLKDGAMKETIYKHILPPVQYLDLLSRAKIRVLDICFGLGYNSCFTIWYYLSNFYRGEIEIYSPEKDEGIFEKLINFPYPQEILQLGGEKIGNILKTLQAKGSYQAKQWKIECFIGDAIDYINLFEPCFFDVIYQDAFSPLKNPELWSREYFQKLFEILKNDGMVTTYSQKSSVKNIVKELDLYVYEIKQEGIRNSRIFVKNELKSSFLQKK